MSTKPTRLVVFAFFSLSGGAMAQTTAHPEFEVASIKPSSLQLPGGTIRHDPGGGLRVTNMSLVDLMQYAYDVFPFQISGGPAWLDSARYDINAKPEHEPKGQEAALMLQALLADRFQLTIHRETRELPVYALVLSRRDGKLGPKLAQSKEDGCTVYDPAHPPGRGAAICGTRTFNPSHGWLTITRQPFDSLAKMLSRILGRTVIDGTGLTGNFDIHLEYTPDENQLAQFPSDPPASSPPNGPSIFSAVQEQLGLKLESQKGPVEILVIDRAEKPSEN